MVDSKDYLVAGRAERFTRRLEGHRCLTLSGPVYPNTPLFPRLTTVSIAKRLEETSLTNRALCYGSASRVTTTCAFATFLLLLDKLKVSVIRMTSPFTNWAQPVREQFIIRRSRKDLKPTVQKFRENLFLNPMRRDLGACPCQLDRSIIHIQLKVYHRVARRLVVIAAADAVLVF